MEIQDKLYVIVQRVEFKRLKPREAVKEICALFKDKKTLKELAPIKQGFLQGVMCRFGSHDWLMDKETVVKCNRTCRRCGKKQHSCYDMSYGETDWLDGHYW